MYLITFPSMTDAFSADKELGGLCPHQVVPVPPKLSETCYGVGVRLDAAKADLPKIREHLDGRAVRYKYFWDLETYEQEDA